MALFKLGISGNPKGRPKASEQTIKQLVTRFIRKNITPTRLQKTFDSLNAKEQLFMLTELLPYVVPKCSPESLSANEIDTIYNKILEQIESKENGYHKAS